MPVHLCKPNKLSLNVLKEVLAMCWKWAPSPNNIAPKDLYYMLFLAPRSARSLLHINFGSEIFIYMSYVWLRDLYYMLFSRVETFISLGLVSLGLVSDQSIVGL